MTSPFAAEPRSIPVRIAVAPASLGPTTAVIHLRAETGHDHPAGAPCPACAARLDIRARLFELLQEVRTGLRTNFDEVLVLVDNEAASADVANVLKAGNWPARALRDHTVAKSFHVAIG